MSVSHYPSERSYSHERISETYARGSNPAQNSCFLHCSSLNLLVASCVSEVRCTRGGPICEPIKASYLAKVSTLISVYNVETCT